MATAVSMNEFLNMVVPRWLVVMVADTVDVVFEGSDAHGEVDPGVGQPFKHPGLQQFVAAGQDRDAHGTHQQSEAMRTRSIRASTQSRTRANPLRDA